MYIDIDTINSIAKLIGSLAVIGGVLAAAYKFYLQGKREQNHRPSLASVTRWLFVTAQIAALCWVSISYLIALYATLRLGQVFPVVELSQQAINTILGVSGLKVVENIFEHNDGVVFGKSKEKEPVSDLDTGPKKEDVSESDTFSDL